MHSKRIAGTLGLGLGAALLAIGLSGCGQDGSGTFREYGALESAGELGQQTEVTPQDPKPVADAPQERPALTGSPVEAPVPLLVDERSSDQAAAVTAGGPPAVAAAQTAGPAGSSDPSTSGGTADQPADIAPREVKILVPERTFKVEGPEQVIRVTFDDIDLLKVMNMDPVTVDAPEKMPQWLRDLDGRRIRIRGYMYPAYVDTGLTAFLIARDTEKCCFGSFAKLYDRFVVRMRKGVTTDYIVQRPFDVVGVFHIDPLVDEGDLIQMYRIDDAVVIEK